VWSLLSFLCFHSSADIPTAEEENESLSRGSVDAASNEGTRTRPDYLVNRADKKNGGAIRAKKLHRNREIVVQ